jgi:predicted small lipoprotein YifL
MNDYPPAGEAVLNATTTNMKNFSIPITVLVLTVLTMTSCGSQYPDAHPTTTKFTPPLISQHTTSIAPTNASPITKTITTAPGSVTWTKVNNLNLVYFIHAVWGSSPSNVFAVGAGGNILHYDGKSWSSMLQSTPEDLLAIWGSSATDVFAVGVGGTIVHYDGKGWSMNMNVIPGMSGDLSLYLR